MIKIFYACNDAMFEPIYLTTLSVVRRTKEPVCFYMFSANLTEMNPSFKIFSKKHAEILNKLVKKYNKQSKFEIIDCTNLYKKYYGDFELRKNYRTPYVLLRTLIANIRQLKGKIIYLDADVMVNKDIKLLYDLDINGHEFAACRDYVLKRRYHKKPYFNAGVMLINIDEVRKTQLFQKVIKAVHELRPTYCEQDCINLNHVSGIEFPGDPFRFNYQWPKIEDNTVVKHFVGGYRLNPWFYKIRQWDIQKVQKRLKIHNWDKDYEIFLEAKKDWNK